MKIKSFKNYLSVLKAIEEYKSEVISSAKLKKGTVVRYNGVLGRIHDVSFSSKTGTPNYRFKPSRLYEEYLINSEEKNLSGSESSLEVLDKNPVSDFLEELEEVRDYERIDSKVESEKARMRLQEIQGMCAHEWNRDGGFFSRSISFWCEVCGKEVEKEND